jgi:hypothetical protein
VARGRSLFQTATADRHYQKNGLDKTVAEFLAHLISSTTPEHLGLSKQ